MSVEEIDGQLEGLIAQVTPEDMVVINNTLRHDDETSITDVLNRCPHLSRALITEFYDTMMLFCDWFDKKDT